MTVQGATFNMCGQLYHRHANATALSSSPVVSALGSYSDDLDSSPVVPLRRAGKKNASSAFRLGYISILIIEIILNKVT